MTPEDLKRRAKAIRLSHKQLGALSGNEENTVGRVLGKRRDKTGGLFATHQKMEAALLAEEIRLRDHLIALHPLPATERNAA